MASGASPQHMDDKRQRGKDTLLKRLPYSQEFSCLYFLQFSISLITVATILYGGYYHCHSIPVPASDDFSEKLTYTLRYCAFPQAVFLLFAIMRVGFKRGSTRAINPLAGNEHLVQTEKNILMNTVEQLLCFLLLVFALTTYLEPEEMRIIPLYSLSFIVGRILFMIGYTINPKYRSVGMSINFFTNIFCVGHMIHLMYTRGFVQS